MPRGRICFYTKVEYVRVWIEVLNFYLFAQFKKLRTGTPLNTLNVILKAKKETVV